MERPTTVVGLTTHLVRTRWQALSARGRLVAIAGATVLAMGGLGAVRMAMGGCCAGSCSMRTAHASVMEAEAPLEAATTEAAATPAATDCPYTH